MRDRGGSAGLRLIERSPETEASLWRRLRYEGEEACRERLFERYQELARRLALRELRRRPAYGLDRTDFIQLAFSGLLEAVDRFDPLNGTPFPAYARTRIRGSISDGLAKSSEGGAQYRHARRLEIERIRSLSDATGKPDEDAIVRLSELVATLAIGFVIQSSRAAMPGEGNSLAGLRAYESVSWRDLELSVGQEIGRLPEAEQTILKQHYLHDMSFTDIASLLGLSKGRISQLHRTALQRLRASLGNQL